MISISLFIQKQHYPEIAESDEVKGKGSELNRKVRQVALTIEKKEGRKQLKVHFFKNFRMYTVINKLKIISFIVGGYAWHGRKTF